MLLVNQKTKELLLNGDEFNNLKEFEILVGSLIKLYNYEKIENVINKVKNEINHEIEIEHFKVSGTNKKSLITQVKSLELPKHIENLLINDIKNGIIK